MMKLDTFLESTLFLLLIWGKFTVITEAELSSQDNVVTQTQKQKQRVFHQASPAWAVPPQAENQDDMTPLWSAPLLTLQSDSQITHDLLVHITECWCGCLTPQTHPMLIGLSVDHSFGDELSF